jgi:hypothetical protein
MNLLRVVTAMAWSDGHLAVEEIDVMLNRFSQLFASDAEQQQALQTELREYMLQNFPLEEVIPKLHTQEERELVLRLGYEVICSSARTPDEPIVNDEEAAAYQNLVTLLDLPVEVVERIEAEIGKSEGNAHGVGTIESLVANLQSFLK